MASTELNTSLTISVFTRHSEDCPKRKDKHWRRCRCKKHLYIREHGETTYISAKTRSWEDAEKFAQRERDKRDPVKLALLNIAEREKLLAEKEQGKQKGRKTIEAALKLWLAGMKSVADTSLGAYTSTGRRIQRWADRHNVVYVDEVLPSMLEEWRASWSPEAEDEDNRLALNTQAALLTRIKAFFRWAFGMEYIRKNPALLLRPITPDESQTWPLTRLQFDELLEAAAKVEDIGRHLVAIFLVQRWTGLRIGDVVCASKTALVGNRLTATIRKKRKRKPSASVVEFVLPDHVVEALTSLPARKEEHRDYWFWSRACKEHVNVNKWVRKVDALSKTLDFKDEEGEPLEFRSHMLRDTFAVEMLLAGVPLEKVSKLLTHESVAITERYYAKWTRIRKQQLEDEAVAAMMRQGATFKNRAATLA
ncbi:MAG TPA: site-specific integrase [Granulicella sp.]